MNPDILIAGAGVAGINAAAALAERGMKAVLVEKAPLPGGHAAGLSCMATTSCARCGACLLEEALSRLPESGVTLFCSSRISACRRNADGYTVTVEQAPVIVDPETCTGCGQCWTAGPEGGQPVGASSLAWGPSCAIGPDAAGGLSAADRAWFENVCPAGAIDFSRRKAVHDLKVGAIVFTGGYTPFDPRLKPRFGYGRIPNVITALEADAQFRATGGLVRPSDGQAPASVAFIQCVGSRDRAIGRDYCSRVCCGYAMRMARLIRHHRPETAVSIFYMDIQNSGRDFGRYYDEIRREAEFVHGIPGELTAGPDGMVLLPYSDETTGRRERREADLVILSVGLGPPDRDAFEILGYTVNDYGFPVGSPEQGLFVAGAAEGPMGIVESAAAAVDAGRRAAEFVSKP